MQEENSPSDSTQVPRAITNLIKQHANILIKEKHAIIPLVHTITPLNAVRILLPYIAEMIASRFGPKSTAGVEGRSGKANITPMDDNAESS